MISAQLRSLRSVVRKTYDLGASFGRKKMFGIFLLLLAQALAQVIGVASIFPILALATDAQGFLSNPNVAKAIEVLPPMSDEQLLISAAGFFVLTLLISSATALVAEYSRNRYAFAMGHWLRMQLLENYSKRPYRFFLENNSGVLTKKTVMDVFTFTNGVLLPALEVIARSVTCLFLIITLLWVNPSLSLVSALIVGGLYILLFVALHRKRRCTSDSLKEANRANMQHVQQFFAGIKPIRVHEASDYFQTQVEIPSKRQSRYMAISPLFGTLPRYVVEPVVFGGIAILIVSLSSSKEMLPSLLPGLGVMALAVYRLLPSVQLLFSQLSNITVNLHGLEEVHEELKVGIDSTPLPSENDTNEIGFKDAIQLREVCFSYEGVSAPTLVDINLAIEKGTSVGIIGESGAGKSTLVDIILGLHTPSSGGIYIDDHLIKESDLSSWRKKIGYVPQEIYLVDGTIAENIAFGVDPALIDKDQVTDAADMAKIADFIASLPNKYDTEVGERGVRLSGGQRQRIGLARALYHAPAILILDEATSALDSATEMAVAETIDQLGGGLTKIVIAHRTSTLKNCDRIVKLDRGSISA